MTDFSFLRLNTSFEVAKSDELIDSEYFYNQTIIFHPQEKYLQISNSNVDIAFDDSYTAELIDCCGNVVFDITDKVFINEAQDNNGIYQIAFEIAPILQDFYYQKLYLKLTQIGGDCIVYSNAFIVTSEEEKNSFRLDYKSYQKYDGIHYNLFNYYQSIRLIGSYVLPIPKEDSQIYTQLNGVIRKSRVIKSVDKQYSIDAIESLNIESLFSALNSDVCYLNGVRITTVQAPSVGERIGMSNLFPLNFTAGFNYSDTYTDVYQILPPLVFLSKEPLGSYTPITIPLIGEAIFNHDLADNGNTIKMYNYDTDALIAEISLTGGFTFSKPVLINGNYYILTNVITDIYGQTIQVTSKEDWKFSIGDGEFDVTEFDSTEFFTN